MNISLIRLNQSSTEPTLGILKVNDAFCSVTLERPWLNNQPDISCIPLGTYPLLRVRDRITSGGMNILSTYEVQIPSRAGVLFHVGNYVRDTHGCILCGLGFSFPQVEPMITNSTLAFSRFIEMTNNADSATLTVSQV